jgi:FkbM family methyltransferase
VTPLDTVRRAVATANNRQMQGLFAEKVGDYDGLVVAGASGLIAERTLGGLARLGTPPVAVVDNNPALWGTSVHDVSVLPPEVAISRYPNAACVAAVFTHTPLRRQLEQLGALRVVSYALLFHRESAIFIPYFAIDDPRNMAADAQAVADASTIWADEESAQLYASIIEWFVTLNSDAVPRPSAPANTYFPDFVQLQEDEVFVDCGGFDGDTVLTYWAKCGGRYKKIIAIEPDPTNSAKLLSRVAGLERTSVITGAVSDRSGTLSFEAVGGLASHASSAGAAGLSLAGTHLEVAAVALDELLPRPTFVKMDIEGFELDALAGARELLSGDHTAFAVTLYHRMSDLWRIPLYIHSIAPELRLFLRHYAEDWAETVCYAVPADRVRKSDT